MKKYILTEETKQLGEHTLYRIQAVRDFRKVKKGDKGGWVASEENLSQNGGCWVYHEACVYENAFVCGNAKICTKTTVSGNAKIYGNARVFGFAKIHGNARVFDRAKVSGEAEVHGNAHIYGFSYTEGKAIICGNPFIRGTATITNNAYIQSNDDVMWIDPVGSENLSLTAFKTKAGKIRVTSDLFTGSLKKFKHEVKEQYGGTKHEKDCLALITYIKKRLG